MKKVAVALLVIVVLVMWVSPAQAQGHRFGAGINVLAPLGDVEDGVGGYASYMFDISDMLATYMAVSHLSGDFDIDIDGTPYKGSYTATQLEAAFLVQWAKKSVVPYAGIGGGYSYISFDDMNVGDKMSLFYMAGVMVPVGDNLSIDLGARLSYLRPRSYDPFAETVDMDSWLVRLGITWDL